MRILAVSDEECPALWEYYVPGRLKDYDLILSCGDLKSSYLSFLVTMARCPVLYVPGNHDTHYQYQPPEGCDCIDGHIVTYRGIRILGLGGCRRYNPGPNQYTDEEMRKTIHRLDRRLRRMGGVDIVLTHCPPEGLGDSDDFAHRGFGAYRELLDKYHPRYFIHGHVHMSYGGGRIQRELQYGQTTIVNAYERTDIEIPEGKYDLRDAFEVLWNTRKPIESNIFNPNFYF